MKLSIIIPSYNEKDLVPELLTRVKKAPVNDKEIILVDDGASDGTAEMIQAEVIRGIEMKENRFGIEPELTLKIAKKKCRVYEVGISY